MWLFLLFIVVPIVEIVLFIKIGGFLGVWLTILVVILTAVIGTKLVKSQGLNAIKEVQKSLKTDSLALLANIWGDTPKIWNPNLANYKRMRTIINYFTRMRFLGKDGSLRLNLKSKKGKKGYIPWFKQTSKNLNTNENIIFGHWASLEGKTDIKNIIGLDTGCVWGNKLTAIRLEDKKLFQVNKK